ncbi:cadherin-like beta sandwich domain-containing protein, partial [bacterium]|nr:cadherin-like beta sandwich domain-containing protein [bacterium]
STVLATQHNTFISLFVNDDATTTSTYDLLVKRLRAEPSHNANLANLTISQGALSSLFNVNTADYCAEVPFNIDSLTVTPTAAGVNASIMVYTLAGGSSTPVGQVLSGTASSPINLTVGTNTITLSVTAEDGAATMTYTLVVRRLTNNADLSALTLSHGTLDFDADTTEYDIVVAYSVNSITVTPTAAGINASIMVEITSGGSTIPVALGEVVSGTASEEILLNEGENTITLLVTAEDGTTTRTYILNVTRIEADHNADLANLNISPGILSPGLFNADITHYTTVVQHSQREFIIIPFAAGVNAFIMVNCDSPVYGPGYYLPVSLGKLASGAAKTIKLYSGENRITFTVVAEDGITTKNYTLTVYAWNPTDQNYWYRDSDGDGYSDGTIVSSATW